MAVDGELSLSVGLGGEDRRSCDFARMSYTYFDRLGPHNILLDLQNTHLLPVSISCHHLHFDSKR